MSPFNSPYTKISTRQTPQTSPILGEKQVKNSAGGYVYALDDFKALERFLILGSEGGTYYIKEQTLTLENAQRTMRCIEADGKRVVDLVVSISDGGRALKNDPAIFVLALCAAARKMETRQYALIMLPKVCRIPTHLFHFLTYVKQFRGFGRSLKRAIGNWYQAMPLDKLAYEVVKYQSRDGWSNADCLRLAHPNPNHYPSRDGEARRHLYKWIVDGMDATMSKIDGIPNRDVPGIVMAFELAKLCQMPGDVGELVALIKSKGLSREMLPTASLNLPEVWDALLPKMPLTALLRNLGNLSKCGLVKPFSAASRMVIDKLHDEDSLRKARIHPLAVLIAMRMYDRGHGLLGKGEWSADPKVTDALDDAFYLAFKTMEPTGKRLLFGVDVSGSMTSSMQSLPISCAEGAAAMAMACVRTEQDYHIMGFAQSFKDLGLTNRMTLKEVLAITDHQNFGSTDCSLPMMWCLKNDVEVDGIIVITDNETYAGQIHPKQALRMYREKTGLPVKEVVIGMVASPFTIADPEDPLTMDVVGFDASVPQAISEFMRT